MGLKKEVFAIFCLTSLIQTLITFEQKIIEDFCWRNWIRHERIFQKCLKVFIFLPFVSLWQVCSTFCLPWATYLFSNQWGSTSLNMELYLLHILYCTYCGRFHDQGDAKWIVIRRSLWGPNNTPCGRPAPGRPIRRLGSGRPQGIIGVFSYYQLVILSFDIVPLIMEFTLCCTYCSVLTVLYFLYSLYFTVLVLLISIQYKTL
jgi:hypothetical protein